jgi:hypothetical protein
VSAHPTPDQVIAIALAADIADFYEGSKYEREATNDNALLYVEDMTDDERRCRRVNNAHAGEQVLIEARRALRDMGEQNPALQAECNRIRDVLRKVDERFERIRELDGE